MKVLAAIYILLTMLSLRMEAVSQSVTIHSPGKKIAVRVFTENDRIYYEAGIDGKKVLLPSKLGLIREDEDFATGMKWKKASAPVLVKDK